MARNELVPISLLLTEQVDIAEMLHDLDLGSKGLTYIHVMSHLHWFFCGFFSLHACVGRVISKRSSLTPSKSLSVHHSCSLPEVI